MYVFVYIPTCFYKITVNETRYSRQSSAVMLSQILLELYMFNLNANHIVESLRFYFKCLF